LCFHVQAHPEDAPGAKSKSGIVTTTAGGMLSCFTLHDLNHVAFVAGFPLNRIGTIMPPWQQDGFSSYSDYWLSLKNEQKNRR
jgi:hypothetical protein